MKVAADYGAPFNLDKAHLGAEYEDPDHFYPLGNDEVTAFKDLLPGKRMPSYYLSATHKGDVDTNLTGKGKTSDDHFNALTSDGLNLDASWKTAPKERDLAEWLALKTKAGTIALNTDRSETGLKANRIAVQRLLRDSSWQHVVKASVDPNARANLRALLVTTFTAAAVVSDGDLTTIGVPPSLFADLDEYKRYDVYRLRVAGPGKGGPRI